MTIATQPDDLVAEKFWQNAIWGPQNQVAADTFAQTTRNELGLPLLSGYPHAEWIEVLQSYRAYYESLMDLDTSTAYEKQTSWD